MLFVPSKSIAFWKGHLFNFLSIFGLVEEKCKNKLAI